MDSFFDEADAYDPHMPAAVPPLRQDRLDELTDGMNENQVEAILHDLGPAIVVAGAGSGKTTVMTKRVAALIERGVRPENILLLTFTNAAAMSMVERARRYSDYADRVTSGTFHSIGLRLIRENIHLFKWDSTPTIMDPSDTETAFKTIMKKIGNKDENLPKAETIAKVHSFATNTMRAIEDVIADKYEQYFSYTEFFEQCIREYKAYKRERSLLDFDDILVIWSRMLDNEDIAAQMRNRFTDIMIDEYQDTNALQWAILMKLGGSNPNMMAVGDPAQSIYAFRGSAPRTMFAFLEKWENSRIIYLNTNYRSTEEVLSIGNAVDKNMIERFDRQLVPVEGVRGDTPEFYTIQSSDQEAVFIAEQVLKLKEEGTELCEQAVLVRSLHVARGIEIEFQRRKIPYRVSGGLKVSEARHIKDFLSLVRCAVNRLDEPAWIRALCLARKVGPGMGEKVFRLIAEAPLDKGDPTALIMAKTKNNPDVEVIMGAWKTLSDKSMRPIVALEKALAALDGIFLQQFPDDWKKSRKQDVQAIVGMADGYQDMQSYLSTLMLDHSVEKSSSDAVNDEEAPITISTVHSAKGLEWDAVFIPGFVKGHFPSAYARDVEAVEEEKRVLYVAVTRPRKILTITAPSYGFQGVRNERSDFHDMVANYCEQKKGTAAPSARSVSFRAPSGFSFSMDDF